jgi:hypothetical protein
MTFSRGRRARAPSDARQRNRAQQRERHKKEGGADRPGDEDRRVSFRQLHGAPEILFEQRPQHEAEQQRRRLAIERSESIPDDPEHRHDQDLGGAAVVRIGA